MMGFCTSVHLYKYSIVRDQTILSKLCQYSNRHPNGVLKTIAAFLIQCFWRQQKVAAVNIHFDQIRWQ